MMARAAKRIQLDLELSSDLARLRLPEGLDRRMHVLLDGQDAGEELTEAERSEAAGLVEVAELLTLCGCAPPAPTRRRMSAHVPTSLARRVRERAGQRCEYCGLSQAGQLATFHLDHIQPRRDGGPTRWPPAAPA